MTVSQIETALQQGLWRLDQSFAVTAGKDFISTLTLGQIIKGKVLRLSLIHISEPTRL